MLLEPCPDCTGMVELTTLDGEPVWSCPDCGHVHEAEDEDLG